MGRARFYLTPELFLACLHLPEETEIRAVMSQHWPIEQIEVVVSHPDLPEAIENARPPFVRPTFRRDSPNDPVVFVEWGL